jgi:superfamily I DNA and/or RNA helicase
MEENNFLDAYKRYLELYQEYLDGNPRIDEFCISNGRRLEVEDSETAIYRFRINESDFLRLDRMMSGELKILIDEQEYENEILSFDKESIVIRLCGVRDRELERICLASDAEILKNITEKQIAILDSIHTNERYRTLCGDFEGAERVQCSFEDNSVERNPKQKEAVEFSVGVKDLFLIWGPPGTGKSTLVPEIIRNYLTRNSDAKILVCSYANRAVDGIVEIICNDRTLMQKIVRVGPSQIRAEYRGVMLRNIFGGERNRIDGLIERRGELDREEREREADARERIRNRISMLENEIGAVIEERRSRGNHIISIKNEISDCESAITGLRVKETIFDGKLASHEERSEELNILSELLKIYLNFGESRFPWLRRRKFRKNQKYNTHRSMIEGFRLESMDLDELRVLERSNQEEMEEVNRSLGELQLSLEEVRREIRVRERGIEDKKSELEVEDKEIEAKKRKESDLKDEQARLEDSLNAEAEELFQVIRRLNIIVGERFERLRRVIAGIRAEREEISSEIVSSEERMSNSRDLERLILSEKQIVATTNLKLLTTPVFEDLHFDLAIMDEAGFTDLPAALGPFVKANRIILIGDHKQLQPITQNKDAFGVLIQQYPFLEKSIFEQFWENINSENKGIMLKKQYRMREQIASFISEEFYDGRLETAQPGGESNLRVAEDPVISSECPLVFINVKAWEVKEWNSWFCNGEIEVVKRIVKKFAEHNGEGIYDNIGVITPFRPQSNRIKDKIPKEVTCGTVHVFQGHEKHIIVYSTVRQDEERGSRSPLLLDERLLNVAVSRAKDKFILLGNKDVLFQLPHYRTFIEHTTRYGQIYEGIPAGYEYTNRCDYCGRPIEQRWRFCAACFEAVEHERDRGGLNQFIDGIIVRSRGNIPTVDGHWVRSEGEQKIDNWLHENSINHRYEGDVKKYLFSLAERFERDLNEESMSRRLSQEFTRVTIWII